MADAVNIGAFNPVVPTHKRKLLEKLVAAQTFQRHWPLWLETEVSRLVESGMDSREIVEKILHDHNVFVKMQTVVRKADAIGINVRASSEI